MSSIVPSRGSAPWALSCSAPFSVRVSPRTVWPAARSSLTTAVPTKPVDPVTKMCIVDCCWWIDGVDVSEVYRICEYDCFFFLRVEVQQFIGDIVSDLTDDVYHDHLGCSLYIGRSPYVIARVVGFWPNQLDANTR